MADRPIDYCLINDLPTLVWAANLANLELHTFLHKASALTRPTALAFDLDPGPPADIIACCRVALWLKEAFDALGLQCFAKTSGSKGMQVFVPLNNGGYERTKAFARAIAEHFEQKHPDRVVARMTKSLRAGKVFIDWSQNDCHKTTICVYSLRARERPAVSTPLEWDEVASAIDHNDAARLRFEGRQVIERVGTLGDLFAPVLKLKQKLPAIGATPAAPRRTKAPLRRNPHPVERASRRT